MKLDKLQYEPSALVIFFEDSLVQMGAIGECVLAPRTVPSQARRPCIFHETALGEFK